MLHLCQGRATEPEGEGPRIIAHMGDDEGRWLDPSVARRWPAARRAWRRWFDQPAFDLGETQVVPVGPGLWVASMVVGRGEDRLECPGPQPIRYPALRKCLRAVKEEAVRRGATLHLDRPAEWPPMKALLLEEVAPEVEVYVYEAPPGAPPA